MYHLKPKQILRFWKWIKKLSNGCWEWQGCVTKSGYGRFQVHPKTLRAHRVAYFLIKGPIPESFLVCHTCDNRRCVNPEHLWIGSSKENTADMVQKGRLIKIRTKKSKASSKYPGISLRKEKKSKRWRAMIMRNYVTVWRGEFETEEEAHAARQKVLQEIELSA